MNTPDIHAGRLERWVRRLRSAVKTNETQKEMVLALTATNMAAFFMRDNHPIGLGIACLLFWPSIAFLINLVDPIE